MTQFADSLCTHFDELQANGHPKWKQVKMELPPLTRGWKYYPPIEKRLRACIRKMASTGGGDTATPVTQHAPKRSCTDAEKVLMLCNNE